MDAIQRLSPDVVFLDVQMPELDGFGVLESIADKPMPLIVFVTAHDKFALRAFEVHAVDYLLKPFDRKRFEAALRHALETRLPRDKFVRISRSAMVNPQRIKELHRMVYGGYETLLQNGARLMLSRRYRDKLPELGVK